MEHLVDFQVVISKNVGGARILVIYSYLQF